MSQSHHKPLVSATPQLTSIPRHNSFVVGLLLICALILMPNHSQSLGSQPAGTKADRLLSNEVVHESDLIGELIDQLSLAESPGLPAAFLSVTPEDVKNAFLAMSSPCGAGAMRLLPFSAEKKIASGKDPR